MNNFSKTLTKYLRDKSITKVASDLGIPKSTLSEWCTSKKGPNLSSMNKVKDLANYLGISFEELIFGETQRESEVLTTVNFKDGKNKYTIKITKHKEIK